MRYYIIKGSTISSTSSSSSSSSSCPSLWSRGRRTYRVLSPAPLSTPPPLLRKHHSSDDHCSLSLCYVTSLPGARVGSATWRRSHRPVVIVIIGHVLRVYSRVCYITEDIHVLGYNSRMSRRALRVYQ